MCLLLMLCWLGISETKKSLTLRGPLPAVNEISFAIEKGKVVGVVGESGSGKTIPALVILRQLPRLAKIHQGSILFNGWISQNFLKKK